MIFDIWNSLCLHSHIQYSANSNLRPSLLGVYIICWKESSKFFKDASHPHQKSSAKDIWLFKNFSSLPNFQWASWTRMFILLSNLRDLSCQCARLPRPLVKATSSSSHQQTGHTPYGLFSSQTAVDARMFHVERRLVYTENCIASALRFSRWLWSANPCRIVYPLFPTLAFCAAKAHIHTHWESSGWLSFTTPESLHCELFSLQHCASGWQPCSFLYITNILVTEKESTLQRVVKHPPRRKGSWCCADVPLLHYRGLELDGRSKPSRLGHPL